MRWQDALGPNATRLSAGGGGNSEKLAPGWVYHTMGLPLLFPMPPVTPPLPRTLRNTRKGPTSLVGGERPGGSCRQELGACGDVNRSRLSGAGSCQVPAWPNVGIHQGLNDADDGGG
jgi:hypothetical protein